MTFSAVYKERSTNPHETARNSSLISCLLGDGRPTPTLHDGMATFEAYGMIHLVRGAASSAALGSIPYDPKATGGTTTLVVDPVTRTSFMTFCR
jgi:hypothetical protein